MLIVSQMLYNCESLTFSVSVKRQILRFQSPTTGLFPRDLTEPQIISAHVRDSVYCAAAVWALAQAYKYILFYRLILI